jgi:hypothetical protein
MAYTMVDETLNELRKQYKERKKDGKTKGRGGIHDERKKLEYSRWGQTAQKDMVHAIGTRDKDTTYTGENSSRKRIIHIITERAILGGGDKTARWDYRGT